VSTIEELFEGKSSSFGLERREYGRGNSSRCPRGTLLLQKLALTSPARGGRLAVVVRLRIQAMEYFGDGTFKFN
jgi:hypothetical protein